MTLRRRWISSWVSASSAETSDGSRALSSTASMGRVPDCWVVTSLFLPEETGPQFASQNLAGRGQREFGAECDGSRILVERESGFDVLLQIGGQRVVGIVVRGEDHESVDRFAAKII